MIALSLTGCAALDGEGVDADLENNLPVDGCGWVVHIRGHAYAPDRNSTALITDTVGGRFGRVRAKVVYELTGDLGQVPCGWGSRRTLPEVSLLQLAVP